MLYHVKLKQFNTSGLIKDKNTPKAMKAKFIYLEVETIFSLYLCPHNVTYLCIKLYAHKKTRSLEA